MEVWNIHGRTSDGNQVQQRLYTSRSVSGPNGGFGEGVGGFKMIMKTNRGIIKPEVMARYKTYNASYDVWHRSNQS